MYKPQTEFLELNTFEREVRSLMEPSALNDRYDFDLTIISKHDLTLKQNMPINGLETAGAILHGRKTHVFSKIEALG